MKVAIVCGDRNWRDKRLIKEKLIEYRVIKLIEGECRGADKLAKEAAEELGIEVVPETANWNEFGLGAGPIRNLKMLTHNPELILAFHDDIAHSKGTKDMVNKARSKNIQVILISHLRTVIVE